MDALLEKLDVTLKAIFALGCFCLLHMSPLRAWGEPLKVAFRRRQLSGTCRGDNSSQRLSLKK